VKKIKVSDEKIVGLTANYYGILASEVLSEHRVLIESMIRNNRICLCDTPQPEWGHMMISLMGRGASFYCKVCKKEILQGYRMDELPKEQQKRYESFWKRAAEHPEDL
jgi:hypothetical protein